MVRRWLAGALLFTLGFGSAKLLTLPTATAQDVLGDGTLQFIEDDESIELVLPEGAETEYLTYATRISEPGTIAPPQISYDTGSSVISKHDLATLTVFRVEPLLRWDADPVGAPLKGKSKSALTGRGTAGYCEPGGPYQCTQPPAPRPPKWHHLRALTAVRAF